MNLLTPALNKPETINALSLKQLDLLIRQARSAGLLSHLYYRIKNTPIQLPEQVKNHFISEFNLSKRLAKAIHWEVYQIKEALKNSGIPFVLLKGAAYLEADLPNSLGRIYSDTDIMVPKSSINTVENILRGWGWQTTHLDNYDQTYYRKWMHELPPMKHISRQSVLDVHHTITPDTSKFKTDARLLLKDAIKLKENEEIYVLSAVDMVLHSATHLFCDGELEHGLRDLVDLDSLLKHFSQTDTQFWDKLIARSIDLNLERPLFYAFRYTRNHLHTPIPESILKQSRAGKPVTSLLILMDILFNRVLRPPHKSCEKPLTAPAKLMVYIRSHYLRMPFYLLIPHLFHKAVISPWNERKEEKKKLQAL